MTRMITSETEDTASGTIGNDDDFDFDQPISINVRDDNAASLESWYVLNTFNGNQADIDKATAQFAEVLEQDIAKTDQARQRAHEFVVRARRRLARGSDRPQGVEQLLNAAQQHSQLMIALMHDKIVNEIDHAIGRLTRVEYDKLLSQVSQSIARRRLQRDNG